MFGHDWQTVEATIVDRQRKQVRGSVLGPWEFVADIRLADAGPARVTIQEPTIATDFWPPDIGDTVRVLFDAGRDKVKFDKDDLRISAKARRQEGHDRLATSAAQAPGTLAAYPASSAAAGMPISLPDGARFVQADPQMLSELFSGDPAQMRAAADALRAGAASAGAGAAAAGPGPASADPAARLAKLDALKASGLLTDEEHADQRRRILDSI